jgi:uncharacterized membrane protein
MPGYQLRENGDFLFSMCINDCMHTGKSKNKEERSMKKWVVMVVMIAMSVCSLVYAYEGKGRGDRQARHELLNQLPADKEMLFHQTMREVREKSADFREQIRSLRSEAHDILTAPEFNEALFLEKTKRIQDQHQMIREARENAIAKLAGQFDQEERKILARLIQKKKLHDGRQPGH